jgi:hypothetical protein
MSFWRYLSENRHEELTWEMILKNMSQTYHPEPLVGGFAQKQRSFVRYFDRVVGDQFGPQASICSLVLML